MTGGLGGRVCLTCIHPQREQIDTDLVSGVSVAAASRRYGISDDSMARHKKLHLPKHRLAARGAEEAADETRRADSLSEWTAKLRQKAASLMEEAEKRGDLRTALAGCREALRACDTMARMSGAIPAAQVNVSVTHHHFQTLQVAILSSLAPFPEARQAVLLALETIEHEEPGP